jgi:glycosyltransferase involved in cell wall biosynthesis
MKIIIVNNTIIPAIAYGGTERVIWGLGKALHQLGHDVHYLVKKGSTCEFAKIIEIDENLSIAEQIKESFDVIHANYDDGSLEQIGIPYIITFHGNTNETFDFNKNMVFISKNHANRYSSDVFVYNGLDWDDYPLPALNKNRIYYHFLGKAAWRLKNVKGAIKTILKLKNEKLYVLGGIRFNISMGIRFTFSPRIKFFKSVNDKEKAQILSQSKGLIFPVRWHEPFGLAIIESLYFGCPVFGTKHGSLPELVSEHVGYLSNDGNELVLAMQTKKFDPFVCHHYAKENFNANRMAKDYLKLYEKVINGEQLNKDAPRLKSIQLEKFLEWS